MRARTAAAHDDLAPNECEECHGQPAKKRLFDALRAATEVPHKGLHTYFKGAKTLKKFQMLMDFLAKSKGKVIDWNMSIPNPANPPAEAPPTEPTKDPTDAPANVQA
jgi:hypothetical protein